MGGDLNNHPTAYSFIGIYSVFSIFSFNTLGEIVSVKLYRQNVQGKMFYPFIDFSCFKKKGYFDTTFFTIRFLYIFEHLQFPPKCYRKISWGAYSFKTSAGIAGKWTQNLLQISPIYVSTRENREGGWGWMGLGARPDFADGLIP